MNLLTVKLFQMITIFAFCGTMAAQAQVSEQGTDSATHPVILSPAEVFWMAAPDSFEPGAELAVLQGDLGSDGLSTARLRLPAGYKVAPHWHGADEHVTVISGEFAIGSGANFNLEAMHVLPAGSYVMMPAEHVHYARAVTDTVIQLNATEPFTMTYADPSDDPRNSNRTAAGLAKDK